MIKKSKKILALSLSLAALFSSVGKLSVFAAGDDEGGSQSSSESRPATAAAAESQGEVDLFTFGDDCQPGLLNYYRKFFYYALTDELERRYNPYAPAGYRWLLYPKIVKNNDHSDKRVMFLGEFITTYISDEEREKMLKGTAGRDVYDNLLFKVIRDKVMLREASADMFVKAHIPKSLMV